ncbi:MAG: hypothetical protein ACR2MQ_11085 [Gemmatimonadaceae bacterium]
MVDKSATPEVTPEDPAAPPATPVVPPKRSPGHRGADVKDTVAEMTAKAHEISLEAGSKMAAAMKDVINAAAGITGFVLESARDLAQYMVRRGQMTQDEADKLIRQAEEAQANRGSTGSSAPSSFAAVLAANDADVEEEDDVLEVSDEESVESGDMDSGSADSETGAEAAAGSAHKTAAKHPAASKTGAATKSKTAAKDEKPAAKKGASAPAAKKGTAKQK